MRIAMVSPYDLAVPGGVQGQVAGLSVALGRLGHDVVVLAPGPPGAHGDGSVLTLGRSVGVRANGSVAPVTVSPAAAFRAGRSLRASAAQVVHLHEPLAPILNYGCLVAARQPIVGTFHRNGSSALYRLLAPAARWATGRLAARCAVSDAARANAAAVVRGPFEVLFNGVETQRFRAASASPTHGPTVLFVGRHERRKGLAVLLEAVSSMHAPPTLWIAGEGPETAELKRRHPPSPTVQWLGAVGDDEKVDRMVGAQVFCAPSLGGESFGMVLLEAMAAGTALVASDIDGYREAAGPHARWVPPGDPEALARALEAALVDAAEHRGRSSAGALEAAQRHAEEWSMERLAGRYVAIYERVVAEAVPRRGSASPQVA